MALPEGFESVAPGRRLNAGYVDKNGKLYLPVYLFQTFGLREMKEEAYQVFFNPKTYEGIIQLVPKPIPGDDSYPLLWVFKGKKHTGAPTTLRFTVAALIGAYGLRIIPGSLHLSFDKKERRIHFNLTQLKEKKERPVKELVCPESVVLLR